MTQPPKKYIPLQMKLESLEYHSADNIDVTNTSDLKILVVWLEDQKIRHYKIDERGDLRDDTGDNWMGTFKKYCTELKCPYDVDSQLMEVADWLVTIALKCEYSDVADRVTSLRAGLSKPTSTDKRSSKSALDIDSSDETLLKGVQALARRLQIGNHPDLTVLLAACKMVMQDKLTENAMKKAKDASSNAKQFFTATPQECGFTFQDPVLAEAAKVLRLLHIEQLRELQTSINELIVEVQRLTANPKTDQTLGKVGR